MKRRNATLSLIGAMGMGAGLMYILDPERGNRRRALARDKAMRALHVARGAADKTARDLVNRVRGTVSEAWSVVRREEVPDEILVERVRAKLGRVVSHPRSIEVTANQGRLTLSGPVLAHEVDGLISSARSVGGVKDIHSRLEIYKQPGDIPGLQGGTGRSGERWELLQANWAPATRMLVGSGGALLSALGIARRDPIGAALGTIGLGMLGRAASNLELKRLLGLGGGRRGIYFQKTIEINAPVDEVYALWSNPENFPRIMSHVQEVKAAADGRSYHWTVAGPGGISISWGAEITEQIPNQVIAWRSVPGATVRNAGIVQFQPLPNGGTRAHVRLCYNPPAGVIGHAVATLFGADPKRAMDDDMVRLKSLFEHGKTTAHGQTVSQPEVAPESRERLTA